jgi:hypothetical protein
VNSAYLVDKVAYHGDDTARGGRETNNHKSSPVVTPQPTPSICYSLHASLACMCIPSSTFTAHRLDLTRLNGGELPIKAPFGRFISRATHPCGRWQRAAVKNSLQRSWLALLLFDEEEKRKFGTRNFKFIPSCLVCAPEIHLLRHHVA